MGVAISFDELIMRDIHTIKDRWEWNLAR